MKITPFIRVWSVGLHTFLKPLVRIGNWTRSSLILIVLSFYISLILWPLKDCSAFQRRNVQQYLLLLIYTYGTQYIKWRKNEGGSKILNCGRGTLRFRVLLCWSIFGRLIVDRFIKLSLNLQWLFCFSSFSWNSVCVTNH